MIELVIKDWLEQQLQVPVYLELPETMPAAEWVLVEKTSGGKTNHLPRSTVAVQSYAPSMYRAAVLNDKVIDAMDSIVALDVVASSTLNSDYPYTDTQLKAYRYQAVYDLKHY